VLHGPTLVIGPYVPRSADAAYRAICPDTCAMGFNPYRKFVAKPADYVFVVAAVAAVVALLLWAVLG